MNFKHLKNLQESIDGMKKIFSISWSPNLMRLAVAHVDEKRSIRISLYDENGEKKEFFQTKAANKSGKSYVVRDIAFSSDSTKLAVSQSDNIIFVYNLGSNWGDKKIICNKFEQNSQITTMIWPANKNNEIYFGIADGKVKMGMLKNNSAQVLYSTESLVISLTCSYDGKSIMSGHLDNSIYKFSFESGSSTKILTFPTIPYCLTYAINNDALIAGADKKVYFLNETGERTQLFDYSHDEKIKDFPLSRQNSAYDLIAVANYNKLFLYNFNNKKNQWEESCILDIEHYYSITALCWKPDVSALAIGSLCGSLDLFESCLKKSVYGEKYEITYMALSQIMVKDLETGRRMTIKSNQSYEIQKLNIHNNNYIVINTTNSLIVGDMTSHRWSEVPWISSGNEKYDFNNINVCLVYNSGEVAIIEYGNNEIVGHCRTEYVHPNLISAKISQMKISHKKVQNIRLIAYLIDPFTIYIQDLNSLNLIVNLTHDSNIEYLEFNKNGTKLLFRDTKRHLNMLYLYENRKVTLLNVCGFVQWVPGTDVLVAQDGKNVVIWYNIDDIDNPKIINIKGGDVLEVRRNDGRSEILVDESNLSLNLNLNLLVSNNSQNCIPEQNTQVYLLDENLISLSIAIEDCDLNKAVSILETLSLNDTDTNIYWKSVAKIALDNRNLALAQRCYAALGYYSKSSYIKKIIKDIETLGSADHPLIEAKLLILDKQFTNAENVMLKNNMIKEAVSMFNDCHRYEASLRIAEKFNLPEYSELKKKYYEWLTENEIFDQAAELKVREGCFIEAIKLYIQGDLQMKAAHLILREKVDIDGNTIEYLAKSLCDVGLFEKAGELMEYVGNHEAAIDCYLKSNCYSKALEQRKILNKKIRTSENSSVLDNETKKIEECWGDYLASQRQVESSVAHFLESGRIDKAVESLILCRNWEKAAELCDQWSISLESQNNNGVNYLLSENKSKESEEFKIFKQLYIQLGEHYLKEANFERAEHFIQLAKESILYVEILIQNKNWDKLDIFLESNSSPQLKDQILSLAYSFQKETKFKEAERLYLSLQEPDMAISMYKNIKHYNEMINLVETYHPEYLEQTYLMLAQKCKLEEKNYKQAEYFYIKANQVQKAIEMYYSDQMIDECLLLANKYLSSGEMIQLCVEIFKNNYTEAKNSLLKLGMVGYCVKLLCFFKQYEEATQVCKKHGTGNKEMLQFINLKIGLEMKDQGRYDEAEAAFIQAEHPEEAVNMFILAGDYNNAIRVARTNCPDMISEVYMRQGSLFLNKGEYDKAEFCYVKANHPEMVYDYYIEHGNQEKAYAFARKYAPELLSNEENKDSNNLELKVKAILDKCSQLETCKNYYTAIEYYIQLRPYDVNNNISFIDQIHQRIISLSKYLTSEEKIKLREIIINKYLSGTANDGDLLALADHFNTK